MAHDDLHIVPVRRSTLLLHGLGGLDGLDAPIDDEDVCHLISCGGRVDDASILKQKHGHRPLLRR